MGRHRRGLMGWGRCPRALLSRPSGQGTIPRRVIRPQAAPVRLPIRLRGRIREPRGAAAPVSHRPHRSPSNPVDKLGPVDSRGCRVIVVVVLFMGCAPRQGDARFIGRRETDDWLCGPCLSSLTIPRFWTICALTSGVPALRRTRPAEAWSRSTGRTRPALSRRGTRSRCICRFGRSSTPAAGLQPSLRSRCAFPLFG